MGNRLLGIDITPASDNDYDKAVALAKEAGAEVVSLSIFWDEIETSPGVFQSKINWLKIANSYYPAQELRVALVISVIDTNQNRLPDDLKEKPFDHPDTIARFKNFLEYVFSQIPDLELVSLSIGNEVDIYLGMDAGKWEQYKNFYNAALKYAHQLHPNLLIGIKATLPGLTGDRRDHLETLNRNSDVILVTYYPLEGDFTVKEPVAVREDFQKLTALYPGRLIYFHETGYPSGARCDSSEQKQAEFVRQVFGAWDEHHDQIGLVIFTWLTDVSPESVREMEKYYGLSDKTFLEYLGTLGLRHHLGTDKDAFSALKLEVQKRSAR
ncbi:MAG: hypothetical protein Kow002_03740 [Anaerolineales bacterium]